MKAGIQAHLYSKLQMMGSLNTCLAQYFCCYIYNGTVSILLQSYISNIHNAVSSIAVIISLHDLIRVCVIVRSSYRNISFFTKVICNNVFTICLTFSKYM